MKIGRKRHRNTSLEGLFMKTAFGWMTAFASWAGWKPTPRSIRKIGLGWTAAALVVLAAGQFQSKTLGQDKPAEKKAGVVTLDGVQSKVPADWKEQESKSQMRAYQFAVP